MNVIIRLCQMCYIFYKKKVDCDGVSQIYAQEIKNKKKTQPFALHLSYQKTTKSPQLTISTPYGEEKMGGFKLIIHGLHRADPRTLFLQSEILWKHFAKQLQKFITGETSTPRMHVNLVKLLIRINLFLTNSGYGPCILLCPE